MMIQKVRIKEIRLADYNPRLDLQPGQPEYEKLKRSIEEFGYLEPLVLNIRTNTLVSGHQRLKVLSQQGFEEVEASIVDLPVEKEKQLNLILNRVRGDWDEEKLAVLLQELNQIPDFDVKLTGFETPEINRLFDEYLSPDPSQDSEPDPEQQGPAVTKRGDLIALGVHRLFCGDSTSPEDLKNLLGDQKIDLWYTDFPYGIAYDSENRPREKQGRKWLPIENDNLSADDYRIFLEKSVQSILPFLKKGASVYLWNGFAKMGCLDELLERSGLRIACMLVWVKPNPSISFADYNWQTEFCAYGWVKGESHKWFGPPNETNLWECPRDLARTLIHPTSKPVPLAQRAMKNSSQRGDIVFDGFAGSGSAIIAAQSMERICYAIELEPFYCDAIVRRYIRTFGRDSVSPEVFECYRTEA